MATLKWFLATNKRMSLKTKVLFMHLRFIQKMAKKRNTCREAKLEVLMNYWSKFTG
jgi:hypothetical protein